VTSFARYLPNGYPDFILQSIATEFGIEIYSEYDLIVAGEEGGEQPEPSYLPLEKPTSEEVARMRADWRTDCEAFDRQRESQRIKWRQEREAAG
jgi:hypothetical protein